MLEASCEKAQRVMLDQMLFNLNAKHFRDFCKLLDAPPKANPGLKRLLASASPWKIDQAR